MKGEPWDVVSDNSQDNTLYDGINKKYIEMYTYKHLHYDRLKKKKVLSPLGEHI